MQCLWRIGIPSTGFDFGLRSNFLSQDAAWLICIATLTATTLMHWWPITLWNMVQACVVLSLTSFLTSPNRVPYFSLERFERLCAPAPRTPVDLVRLNGVLWSFMSSRAVSFTSVSPQKNSPHGFSSLLRLLWALNFAKPRLSIAEPGVRCLAEADL